MGDRPKDLNKLLEDPLIQAVGLVTVNAGAFELAVTHLLWALRGPVQPGEAPRKPRETKMLGKKLEAVTELTRANVADPAIAAAVNRLVARGQELSSRRAEMVHGAALEVRGPDGSYGRLLAKWFGFYEEAEITFALDDVLGLARDLWRAREDAIQIMTDVAGTSLWARQPG